MLKSPAFPNLSADNSRVTSPTDPRYNCVAWAAGETATWWWPGPPGTTYWPPDAPRAETMEAFIGAFATLGYETCANATAETGFEKIAVFELAGKPTHVARQLPGGLWSSKLGKSSDVEHTLDALDGPLYGRAMVFLARILPEQS
jgi:hypothetical protein